MGTDLNILLLKEKIVFCLRFDLIRIFKNTKVRVEQKYEMTE
jgi:hypothetical protein